MLTPNLVGNVIRKRFEADLHEFMKVIHCGKIEASNKLLNRLMNSGPIYIKKSGGKLLDADNLVFKIESELKTTSTDIVKINNINNINNIINSYSTCDDLKHIVDMIKEFTAYEKLIIHSLSHSTTAMPLFNQKEVKACVALLAKLESAIQNLNGGFTL